MADYSTDSIYSFAACTGDNFDKLLSYLSITADPEDWTGEDGDPVSNLRHYIEVIFRQCNIQNKIGYSRDKDKACINLGLRHRRLHSELVLVFDKFIPKRFSDTVKYDWYVRCVLPVTDRQFTDYFDSVPEHATFAENTMEYGFDTSLPIEINFEHMMDNWERISKYIPLSRNVIRMMLLGAIEESKSRIKRNPRLAIPEFHDNELGWFIPVRLPVDEGHDVVLALALSKLNNHYRANTIFTQRMAISHVRVLFPLENEWLLQEYHEN